MTTLIHELSPTHRPIELKTNDELIDSLTLRIRLLNSSLSIYLAKHPELSAKVDGQYQEIELLIEEMKRRLTENHTEQT